jgi:hypothetical protein
MSRTGVVNYDYPFIQINRDGVDLFLIETDCGFAVCGTQDDAEFGWLAEYGADRRKV